MQSRFFVIISDEILMHIRRKVNARMLPLDL